MPLEARSYSLSILQLQLHNLTLSMLIEVLEVIRNTSDSDSWFDIDSDSDSNNRYLTS